MLALKAQWPQQISLWAPGVARAAYMCASLKLRLCYITSLPAWSCTVTVPPTVLQCCSAAVPVPARHTLKCKFAASMAYLTRAVAYRLIYLQPAGRCADCAVKGKLPCGKITTLDLHEPWAHAAMTVSVGRFGHKAPTIHRHQIPSVIWC